ncbi:hypothetical protein S100390_v1c09530 [Spiroplasma sp. NBRC 100390]|uniref:hypothetical protein n=1 Tax=unclassified Spiroplasma TaxID=2637901 RepID=UPI0008927EAE|nr:MULTISPECIES: hypothetical protein [unclassified Spiroplasma]AOX44289.1 hypothetical protein STU14_v1c09530 [Spiroplasma sp. TU-14]APE13759.1 hypothetical protein S100390_v1c09530 [Spiroplasma sp. NBRC 100390]
MRTIKKVLIRRVIIILGFLLPIVVFLSVIFVFIYKNILISSNKPEPKLQVFNKEGETILEPNSNKVLLEQKRLRLKINYVYGEYYFNNERLHYYFLKWWIRQMVLFRSSTSYLSFYYSNEQLGYSKLILIYHYHDKEQLYQVWKITL